MLGLELPGLRFDRGLSHLHSGGSAWESSMPSRGRGRGEVRLLLQGSVVQLEFILLPVHWPEPRPLPRLPLGKWWAVYRLSQCPVVLIYSG